MASRYRVACSSFALLGLLAALPAVAIAESDCNNNGTSDAFDISHQISADCNENAVPDECDLSSGTSLDCDGSDVPDECDTAVAFATELLDPMLLFAVLWMDLGDIDGDSDLDLLINDTPFNGEKAWYENVGGGSFVRRVYIENGAPKVTRLSDVDEDGDLDILLAYSDLTWFENTDGLGSFSEEATLLVAEENLSFARFTLADIDADGDDDLVATQCGGSPEQIIVTWHENLNGSSAFGPVNIVYSGTHSCGTSIDATDIDRDGDADILLANGALQWFENLDHAGSFGMPRMFGTGYWVRTFDLDSDGDQDVLGQLDWHENLDGVGSFGPARAVTSNLSRMYAADMDGDGDRDIVGLEWSIDAIRWYENIDGQGTLGAGQDMFDDVAGGLGPLLFDLDADGDMDAVAPYDSGVMVLENQSDDCDGNGVPDTCQADCNASGMADVCDVRAGNSADCNRNLVPDECEMACAGACDRDLDLCADEYDCAAEDSSVWAEPSAARGLTVYAPSTGKLLWNPPADQGATTLRYDTLRSASPADFSAGALCVESDGVDRTSEDLAVPPAGSAYYYLIRVENECPGGSGSMGASSSGSLRSGVDCTDL